MTLFTAEGILQAGAGSAADSIRKAYQRWLKTQGYTPSESAENLNSGWLIKEKQLYSCRAPGRTCIYALCENTLRAFNNSKGCGTVMRLAPVGVFYSPLEAYEKGCEFSAVTHGHATGITAGGAFSMLISYLLRGESLTSALELVKAHLSQFPEAAETLAAVQKAETAADISELGEGWVAEEALAVGIYCALQHPRDFRAGVLKAVNITGDSDSTGAIAGNILGVMNGESAIPEKWRQNLREYAIVSRLADELC